MAAAAKAYSDITAALYGNRAVIDEIVKQANMTTPPLRLTPQPSRSFTVVLWSLSGFVFIIIVAGLAGVAKGIIQPITNMTGVMPASRRWRIGSEIPSLP